MQQALSLDTPKTAVLTKEKLAKITGDLKDKGESKGTDFLAMMLSQLANSGTKTAASIAILPKNTAPETPISVKTPLETVEAISEEKATFAQLLHLIETINGGEKTLKFPKLTQKLEAMLAQEGVIKELKEVKSLHDVMKLSQKYDLGLEKITLSSKEFKTFETLFPKLTQNNFFEPKQETIASETLLKSKQTDNSSLASKKEESTTLKDLLRTFENKKETKVDSKGELKTETKVDTKSELKGEIKPELKTDPKVEPKAQIIIEDKKEVKKEVKVTPKETPTLAEKVAIEPKQTPKTTTLQETRVEPAKIQPVSPQPAETKEITPSTQASKAAALKTLGELSQGETRGQERETSSQEGETKHQNTFSKEVGKQDQGSLKTPQLRQTFNTFAQDFKEQVENYKPPMMKIQMALNPKNLGEVEVTLINRGNNLHVNLTSNTSQTLSLFVQNQAEFKNALVNMGFTNLEMNFSQKERQDNPQGGTSKGDFSSEAFDDALEEEGALELILPNYV